MSTINDNQQELDERNIARITELEEQLRNAQAYNNTLVVEAERNQGCRDLLQKQWVDLTAKVNVAEVNLSHAQRDIRTLRAENRALRIKLRAANKGAERNAHKIHGLFIDIPDVFSDHPTAMEISVRMTVLKRKYDL